jgi:DNA-binding transcriptional LysR family regulator
MSVQPLGLRGFDLNLLRVLDALLITRGVTSAAARLGLSQPAVSAALLRLRNHFRDPLLVRKRNRMLLTPLAEELRPALARVMGEIGTTFGGVTNFDPAVTRRRFRLGATDYAAHVVLPQIVRSMIAEAPACTVEILPCDDDPLSALASRELDVVIADRWRVKSQREVSVLFDETFISLARIDHPRLPEHVDLNSYLAEDHALIAPRGLTSGNVDQALRSLGRTRRVALTVPYYLAAAALVATTDLILTLPRRIASNLHCDGRLRLFEPPLAVPGFDVVCASHPRGASEMPIMWLQQLIQRIVWT